MGHWIGGILVKGFESREGVEGDRNEHVPLGPTLEESRRSVEPFSLGGCSATTFRSASTASRDSTMYLPLPE